MASGQIPDRTAERMRRSHLVVPERSEQQASCMRDPSAEIADEIERRLVRPMQVLDGDDHERGRLPQARADVDEQSVAIAWIAIVTQLSPDLGNRSEGAWRGQRIAIAAEDPIGGVGRKELGKHRALADPGLTAHERDLPASALGNGASRCELF